MHLGYINAGISTINTLQALGGAAASVRKMQANVHIRQVLRTGIKYY